MNSNPENTNLMLARLIDQQNRGERVSFPADDGFVWEMIAFREEIQKDWLHADHDSASDWNSIERATKPITRTKVTVLPIYYKIAVAALLLLVAFWTVFMLIQTPEMQVFSSKDQIQMITLSDGSKVTLRPFSTLSETVKNDSNHQYELTGEAFFEIEKNPDRLFSVRTTDGRVEVLGTTFNVSTWADETRVYLLDGSVQVRGGAGDSHQILKPGEQVSMKDGLVLPISEVEQDEIIHWMNQTLRFRERQLDSILNELEHHFNITISAPDSVRDQTLSGTIILSDREQTLLDLGLVLGGRFIQTDDSTYYFSAAN